MNHMSFNFLQNLKISKDDVPVQPEMTEDEVKKFEEDWTCESRYHQK